MAAVTLYIFQKSNVKYTVYRDDVDYTFIDFFSASNPGFPDSGPPINTIVSVNCAPGTTDQYTYKTKINPPYAYYSKLSNAPECGYTPPACDIAQKTFTKTDETAFGANDGTANFFCVTSFSPITYYLGNSGGIITNNTTGLFTGLAPDATYYIDAIDANNCEVQQHFTIEAFDTTKTHFKYRVKFTSIDGKIIWELRLLDMKHLYDPLVYPLDVTASSEPIVKTVGDPNEDKTTAIISTSLKINLVLTGLDFAVEEFIVPEKSWRAELYKNDVLDFQGWVIPDETQNEYSDPPYEVQLIATDGLPSLKGNFFGNGSGGQGYGQLQIQQYGLAVWCDLVQQCLNQLSYNYGKTTLLSSLQYNSTYDVNLWITISTWSDILYDSSGSAMDTYSALDLLLSGMKLCIFQHNGYFILMNWNDLYYLNNGLRSADFQNAIYQFGETFENIAETGLAVEQPVTHLIGFKYPNQPINPPQGLNYDKAYNIEEDISFNVLALLYENPSFEIGAVQGQLPPDFNTIEGTVNAYCNYDPITSTLNSGAYSGDWELKVFGGGIPSPANCYFENNTPIPIDQANKLLNVSLKWKVPACSNTTPAAMGYVFSMAVVFRDATSGTSWFLQQSPSKMISQNDYLVHSHVPNASLSPAGPFWRTLNDGYYTEGDCCSIKGSPTNEYTVWNDFNITAPVFPETQIGTLNIRLYGVKCQLYDTTKYVLPNAGLHDYVFIDVNTTDPGYYLIDDLEVTLSDASPSTTLQTGEKHITSAVVTLPNANVKTSNPSLFTFPTNKRVAGNIFYGTDYATAQVANLWNFALKTNDKPDRLPAAITKAIARTYSRQMYKWEGDVEANDLSFYAVFQIKTMENKVFVPFAIETQLRYGICHLVLIEIDDTDAQNIYTYTPIYQRSARQNG